MLKVKGFSIKVSIANCKEVMEAAHGCKEVEAMVGVGEEIRYEY